MDQKKTLTSTAEFGRTILSVQTPQVEPEPIFTQAAFLKSPKKASRRKRPPKNGKDKPKEE